MLLICILVHNTYAIKVKGILIEYNGLYLVNSSIYYSGTGTSFDIKAKFPNDYQRFSISNFIICSSSASGTLSINGVTDIVGPQAKTVTASTGSYNSVSGLLTISLGNCNLHKGTNIAAYTSGVITQSAPKVYLVDGIIANL